MPIQVDPYDVLGISRDATNAEIEQAYRKCLARNDPAGGGQQWVHTATQQAYELLQSKGSNEVSGPDSPASELPPHQRVGKVVELLFARQLPLQNESTLFILVSVLDIFLTYLLINLGAVEANPVANFFLDRWGFNGMIWFKLAIVAGVCVVSQAIATRQLPRARWVLWIGILVTGAVVLYSVRLLVGRIP